MISIERKLTSFALIFSPKESLWRSAMSSKSLQYKILASVLMLTLLAGCTAAQSVPTATPTTAAPAPATVTPTQLAAPTLDQSLASTQSAQATAAAQTLNAPTVAPTEADTSTSAPTEAPTATSTPAPTQTLVLPTPLPTVTFYPWTLTPNATSTGYACAITSTTPSSSDTVKVSTNFNFVWVIKNTGTKLWGQHHADLKYISGTAMQTKANLFDFTSDVAPGASYTATVAMLSPATANTYSAVWEIIQDSELVCTLNLSVKVVP
jgi:hypothetical protein